MHHAAIVLSDAHLGQAPTAVTDALHQFLAAIPALAGHVVINGDLFDFWFSYRRVIPRAGFRVASALAALGRRIPIAMTGGNHDRWGDSFWDREAGIQFGADGLRFQVGKQSVFAVHGDGLAERRWSARFLHRVTRHPATIAVFGQLPPGVGFWLVDRLSGQLADSTRDPTELDRAAESQRAWAEARLRDEPSLHLLVMGHTHRACLSEPDLGRRYVNPGAWFDGMRYAVASTAGVALHRYG